MKRNVKLLSSFQPPVEKYICIIIIIGGIELLPIGIMLPPASPTSSNVSRLRSNLKMMRQSLRAAANGAYAGSHPRRNACQPGRGAPAPRGQLPGRHRAFPGVNHRTIDSHTNSWQASSSSPVPQPPLRSVAQRLATSMAPGQVQPDHRLASSVASQRAQTCLRTRPVCLLRTRACQ